MLDELRIRGLGVIDDAVLPLGPGLTVVTGETGAGKTMVITGLLLLFGGRADPARVRTGCDQASVEGRLRAVPDAVAARVRDAGGELDDDELVLRRVVTASGRSRAYAGGAGAPVAVLAELAEDLLAVHGQSDQLRILRPAAQRAMLDRYAGLELDQFSAAYTRWREATQTLADRLTRAAELRRESDLLAHGIAEIEAAAPQSGELDELAQAAARLGQADSLTAAARAAHDALVGNADDPLDDALDVSQLLGAAGRALAQQQGTDAELDALHRRLGELAVLAADLAAEFRAYGEALDADPGRLEQVEDRRAVLIGLIRKYCDEPEPSVDAVLRWADSARARLAEIDVSDEAITALRAAADAAARAVADLAAGLTESRRKAAAELSAAVTAELAGLAMADAAIQVEVNPRASGGGLPTLQVAGVEVGVAADGADEVQILLQAHPGAPALPIGRGASGGELSRVMLALEVSLAGSDPVPTMVFDEVDAGVGGRAAVEVGRRLARLARDRQVLVVTHLAQVAAFADRHVVVDKPAGDGSGGTAGGGVTASDVRLVEGERRVAELARMLAGSDSATAREHAAELLADAAEQARAEAERRPAPKAHNGGAGKAQTGTRKAPRNRR